jgi:hypothetical protein
MLEAYLGTQFKGLPSEQHIRKKQYLILDAVSENRSISENE